MKKVLFVLSVLFSIKNSSLLAQVNFPTFNADILYSSTQANIPPNLSAPFTKISMDYISAGGNAAQWAVASVTDIQQGPSLDYYVSVATPNIPINDYYKLTASPGNTIYSPDIVIYDKMAFIIYIEEQSFSNQLSIRIDKIADIRPTSSGGLGSGVTNIYNSPIFTTTNIPFLTTNIDANLAGDFAICYSDGNSNSYFFQGNFNTTNFTSGITWNSLFLIGVTDYETADIAVDYQTGDAFAVTSNRMNGTLDFFLLSANSITKNWTTKQHDYTVPKIACAPSSNYSVPFTAVALNINNNVELIYLDPTLNAFNYNEITSGNSGLGINGFSNSLVSNISNGSPAISYNKPSCGTISVIWNAIGINRIIGVDIKAGVSDPFPYADLDDNYGIQSGNLTYYLPVTQTTSCALPVAICGRFADTKAAGFITSNNYELMHHHWDCVGAWRTSTQNSTSPASHVILDSLDYLSHQINVAPSLFNDEIIITNLKVDTKYYFEIYTDCGILAKTFKLQTSTNFINLDLVNLNSGLYLLKVFNEKNEPLATNKIVKLN